MTKNLATVALALGIGFATGACYDEYEKDNRSVRSADSYSVTLSKNGKEENIKDFHIAYQGMWYEGREDPIRPRPPRSAKFGLRINNQQVIFSERDEILVLPRTDVNPKYAKQGPTRKNYLIKVLSLTPDSIRLIYLGYDPVKETTSPQ